MSASKQDRRESRENEPAAANLQGGEIIAIGWILAVLTSLATQFFGSIAAVAATAMEDGARANLLFHILIVSSAITGVLSLVLLPIVYRLPIERPPTPFVVISFFIAAVPLVVVVWLLIR